MGWEKIVNRQWTTYRAERFNTISPDGTAGARHTCSSGTAKTHTGTGTTICRRETGESTFGWNGELRAAIGDSRTNNLLQQSGINNGLQAK